MVGKLNPNLFNTCSATSRRSAVAGVIIIIHLDAVLVDAKTGSATISRQVKSLTNTANFCVVWYYGSILIYRHILEMM